MEEVERERERENERVRAREKRNNVAINNRRTIHEL